MGQEEEESRPGGRWVLSLFFFFCVERKWRDGRCERKWRRVCVYHYTVYLEEEAQGVGEGVDPLGEQPAQEDGRAIAAGGGPLLR